MRYVKTNNKKNQESMTHLQEKKQSIETIPKEFQALDLLNKDFRSAIINIVKTQLTLEKHGNYGC